MFENHLIPVKLAVKLPWDIIMGACLGSRVTAVARPANNNAMDNNNTTAIINDAELLITMLESILNDFRQQQLESSANTVVITPIIRSKLRYTRITYDMMSNTPSCSLCLLDFELSEGVTMLPCSHIFHKDCVTPWVEKSCSCPICRSEISDVAPSMEELMKYDAEDIIGKLRESSDQATEYTNDTPKSVIVCSRHFILL